MSAAGRKKGQDLFDVEAFDEKTRRSHCGKVFVKRLSYYWNSGMYMFCAKEYLDELKNFK